MLGRLYGIKMFGRLYGIFKAAKTHKAFKRPSALSPNTRLCHTWYYFNTILDNISTQSLILFQHNTWALFQHNIQHYFNTKPDTISKQYLNALSMQYLVQFQHNAQSVWCICILIKNNLLLHNTMLHALLLVSPIHPYNTEQYPRWWWRPWWRPWCTFWGRMIKTKLKTWRQLVVRCWVVLKYGLKHLLYKYGLKQGLPANHIL